MKVLQRHAGVDKLPRAQLFGPDTLAQFREKYAQDNDLLFTEWGLAPRYREYYSFG
jgi:hypothetical protein